MILVLVRGKVEKNDMFFSTCEPEGRGTEVSERIRCHGDENHKGVTYTGAHRQKLLGFCPPESLFETFASVLRICFVFTRGAFPHLLHQGDWILSLGTESDILWEKVIKWPFD